MGLPPDLGNPHLPRQELSGPRFGFTALMGEAARHRKKPGPLGFQGAGIILFLMPTDLQAASRPWRRAGA